MSYYTRCCDSAIDRVSENLEKLAELERQDKLINGKDILYLMKYQWLFVFRLPVRIIKIVVGK